MSAIAHSDHSDQLAPKRKNSFCLIMSCLFWVIMVVGFSDNWLFDIGQESNSDPRFVIHGILAFGWFTILVVQAALARASRFGVHVALGFLGFSIYAAFFGDTGYLYLDGFIEKGKLGPLTILNLSMFLYGSLLIGQAFLIRNKDSDIHRANIMIGTLMLMEPGIGRALGHLIGKGSEPVWLLVYLILFAVFAWQFFRHKWRVAIGFLIWLVGVINFIANMA